MPSFIRNTSGGKAISGGALAPRSRRGNATAQVAAYWAGGATGPDATGGIGAPVEVSISGVNYKYLQFNTTGTLTVTNEGTFVVYSFAGGNGGQADNGYNGYASGGAGGGNGTITKTALPVGTYTITVGAGAAAGSRGAGLSGNISYFGTDNTIGGTYGAVGGGGAGGTHFGTQTGGAGTQVNTFIGGSSLFKGAGGGSRGAGAGGSGIGGNGAYWPNQGGTPAANTASGGGGGQGYGQPLLYQGYAGGGGSGIVYVRWIV